MCRPPDIVPQLPTPRRVQQQDVQAASLGARLNGFAAEFNSNAASGWDWSDLVASGGSQQDVSRMSAAMKQAKKPVKAKKPMPSPLVMAALKGMFPAASAPQQQLLQQLQQQQQQPHAAWAAPQNLGGMQAPNSWNKSLPVMMQKPTNPAMQNFLGRTQTMAPMGPAWNAPLENLNSLEAWAKGGTMAPAPVAPEAPYLSHGIPLGMIPDVDLSHADGFGLPDDGTEDDGEVDGKKYKRMMSNRASAKRSRQRRQLRLDELEIQSAKLRVENAAVQRKLNEANEQIQKYQEQNDALQKDLAKLRAQVQQGKVAPSSGTSPSSAHEASNEHCEHSSNGPSEEQRTVSESSLGKRKAEYDLTEDLEDVKPAVALLAKTAPPAEESHDKSYVCMGSESGMSGPSEDETAVAGESEEDVVDADFFSKLMECFDGKNMDSFLF